MNGLRTVHTYLVKLLETDHVCVFTEGLSGHVQSIFLDQTNSFLAIDTTVTVTFTGSILAFVSKPDIFVAHISRLK